MRNHVRPAARPSAVALAAIMTLLVSSPQASAQLTGAIFTSNAGGAQVNGNIYVSKADVYLNGGPPPNAPCTSGGLPNGDYYFQVTNPSGDVLLSTDPIAERAFRVANGVITDYLGTTHAVLPGTCAGAKAIALAPFDDTPNNGGEYKLWATRQADYWAHGGFSPAKTDNFKIRAPHECLENDPNCPPEPNPAITGLKFYDTDTNGTQDGGEPGVQGWLITKSDGTTSECALTSTNGAFSFLDVDPGHYTITEGDLASWVHTTATSHDVDVAGVDVAVPPFGNVCLGAGGGKTLGFWSNRNGAKLVGAADLAALSALNLRTANGAPFHPTTFAQLNGWLLSGNAVNMAYMLSVQMAAMYLNVYNGLVSGSALVYAPGTQSANAAGFATVNALLTEANTELGLHGVVLAGDPNRTYQEALKNAFDKANNNTTFVQPPGTCPVSFTCSNP